MGGLRIQGPVFRIRGQGWVRQRALGFKVEDEGWQEQMSKNIAPLATLGKERHRREKFPYRIYA